MHVTREGNVRRGNDLALSAHGSDVACLIPMFHTVCAGNRDSLLQDHIQHRGASLGETAIWQRIYHFMRAGAGSVHIHFPVNVLIRLF